MRKIAVFAVLSCGLWAACSEHFPRVFEKGREPALAAAPVGLDARPVSTTCKAPERPVAPPAQEGTLVRFEPASTAKLEQPVEVVLQNGSLYILELPGRVLRLSADGTTTSVVLDIREKVAHGGEAGLLGMAFHPKFSENGFVYLYYTAKFPTGTPKPQDAVFESALVRLHSDDGGETFDPASEKRLLTVNQPYSNHNGGTLEFGPDGFLYYGLGDGGSGGDPQKHGQNKQSLLGKMLRIDVDKGDPYAIPADNPFATGADGKAEIYALGLRNPFRFRFDAVTSDLWAGDVGQGSKEEIDKVVRGGNYGWNFFEGKDCYAGQCPTTNLIAPVVDHGRDEASCITGGVVYRGDKIPAIKGKYVYGDYGQGTFFAIPPNEAAPTPLKLNDPAPAEPKLRPVAFRLDGEGEILFVDFAGSRLMKIVPKTAEAPAPPPEMPGLLSDTGCINRRDPKTVAEGLFPYDVNVAEWVDGATAIRALSIPSDQTITSTPEGVLTLPVGSVAMKTFVAEGKILETQLLLHRPNDTWDAYSYVWNVEQTNATLAESAMDVTLPSGRKHHIVDRKDCVQCHKAANRTIALTASQLDRDDVPYATNRMGNPLATLEHLKMVASPIARTGYTALPRARGFQTAERRARGYLDANCAHCHQAPPMDLRFGTAFNDTGLCSSGRLKPNAPDESPLVRVMKATDTTRMPPLVSRVPDEEGVQMVSSWITTISSCP